MAVAAGGTIARYSNPTYPPVSCTASRAYRFPVYSNTLANIFPITDAGYCTFPRMQLVKAIYGTSSLWATQPKADTLGFTSTVRVSLTRKFARRVRTTAFLSSNEGYYCNFEDSGRGRFRTGNGVPESATRIFLLVGLVSLAGVALKKSL
jgi:hypothetical protein